MATRSIPYNSTDAKLIGKECISQTYDARTQNCSGQVIDYNMSFCANVLLDDDPSQPRCPDRTKYMTLEYSLTLSGFDPNQQFSGGVFIKSLAEVGTYDEFTLTDGFGQPITSTSFFADGNGEYIVTNQLLDVRGNETCGDNEVGAWQIGIKITNRCGEEEIFLSPEYRVNYQARVTNHNGVNNHCSSGTNGTWSSTTPEPEQFSEITTTLRYGIYNPPATDAMEHFLIIGRYQGTNLFRNESITSITLALRDGNGGAVNYTFYGPNNSFKARWTHDSGSNVPAIDWVINSATIVTQAATYTLLDTPLEFAENMGITFPGGGRTREGEITVRMKRV